MLARAFRHGLPYCTVAMDSQSMLDREPTSQEDADMEAIHALSERLTDAWKEGDGAAFAEQFTENADYVVYDGSHLTGRAEIAQRHQELFDTLLRGSHIESQIENIRFLSEDVAIVHSTGGVQLRWQRRLPSKRDSIQTHVAVKQDGGWKFTAFQNTRIQNRNWLQEKLVSLLKRL